MPHREDRFCAHDGLRLHENCWLPAGEPGGVVVVVHGLNDHSGRYTELAARLNRHGYAVYAMDLRGHGKSQGARLLIRSFDEYLADLELHVDRVRRRGPDKPLFLFGHSMGGAIVALLGITRQPDVRGLVLSVPAVVIGGGVSPLLRRLAPLVSRLFPRLRIMRLGYRTLCRDPEVVEQFKNDPLVYHGRFPVRTGAEILRAAGRIQDQMEALKLPLLLLHGTADMATDPEGSRRLHARAGSTDKTLKLYEGLFHDLLHEPEKEQVTADLIEWLDARR